MKRLLLLGSIFTIVGAQVNAQTTAIDTVSVGAGYVNQNYYQLSTGTKSPVAKNEWDIAFQTGGASMGYSIMTNAASGVDLYTYPNAIADSAHFAGAFDTTGLSTWPKMYNSETTWSTGAFSQHNDPANAFDLGWGLYDLSTHIVTGDSLFVVKTTNGTFKKVWIKNLNTGIYNFSYANLDGTNPHTVAFAKANYDTKNFGYYSLSNDSAVDHEPVVDTAWDLLFTQYTANLGGGYMGTATGILANEGVVIAKATNVANTATYVDYATQTYSEDINIIGWNWKTYNQGANAYTVEDSTVYFVQAKDSAIWKVVMTGFGASANGNMIFSKIKLKSAPVVVTPPPPTAINSVNNLATLSIYPNPVAQGTNLNVVVDLMQANANVNLAIYDITGKQVFNTKVANQTGLKALAVPTAGFKAGLYIISLDVNGYKATQKVSIQ